MRVDVRALGACNRLAERGAERAAAALTDLTGTALAVEVTGVSVAAADGSPAAAATDGEWVGVRVGLSGGLSGAAVLAFDADRVDGLLELLPGDASLRHSAVTEVGNIALGGFLDGFANHLGRAIELTPPQYVSADDPAMGASDGSTDDPVFRFESRLEAATNLDFSIALLPAATPFRDLAHEHAHADAAGAAAGSFDAVLSGNAEPAAGHAETATTGVTYDALLRFASLAAEGSETAAANIEAMTGLETTVDVSRLRFVPLTDVPTAVGTAPHAGTVFELHGEPSGYLAILFAEPSAARIADAMLPMEPAEPLGEMAEHALCELGNVMTSGLIDGWANVLETSISHSPPEFVHDIGAATVSPLVAALSRRQDYGFVVDATIRTRGVEARCDVYVLPDERELVAVLRRLADP